MSQRTEKKIGKRSQATGAKRQLILTAALAVFSQYGIHGARLEQVAERAGVSKTNLLYYYPSKEALYVAVMRQILDVWLAPLKGKGYFVFHDAYGYYEKHYGLTPLGHFTVNPEIQPGAQRLHEIRTQLVEQKATCVFAEPQFRPAVVEAVARGTSVRMGTLDPLGTNIKLGKTSYSAFLSQLANQYASCLKGD
ncbi:high-affinity zinc transporter periplasmic protein [Salmonella enterica subsp. enterica serovar Typhimurium str. DT104]|nr:high-affinity zinc transporter periplasmic protein [Salmonella enterica subsp. enterica serovar Typhimurium str. DT104]